MDNIIADEQPVENAPEVSEEQETVTLSKAEVDALIQAADEATQLADKKAEEYTNLQKWNMQLKRKLEDNGIESEQETPQIDEERIAQLVKDAVAAALPQTTPQGQNLNLGQMISGIQKFTGDASSLLKTPPPKLP